MTQLDRKSTEYLILSVPFHFQLVVSNINPEAKILSINLKILKKKVLLCSLQLTLVTFPMLAHLF